MQFVAAFESSTCSTTSVGAAWPPESSPPNARSSCLSRTRAARFTPWQTRGPAGRQRARVHRQGPRRVGLPTRSAYRLHRSRKTDPKPVRRELHVSLLSLRIASTAMSTSTNTGLPASRMPGTSSTLDAGTLRHRTTSQLTEKPHPGAVCHAAPEHRSFPGTPLTNRRPSQKTAGADGEGDLGSAGAHLECASPTRKRPRVRKSDPTNWSGSFPEPNAYIIFLIIF